MNWQWIRGRAEKGFSLIEVMLGSLILSLGLLGFVQAQLLSLRMSEQAYFVNLADLKISELTERLKSCSNESPCIQDQLNFWQAEIKKNFPEGEEQLTRQGHDYQSEIRWISFWQRPKQTRFFRLLFRP